MKDAIGADLSFGAGAYGVARANERGEVNGNFGKGFGPTAITTHQLRPIGRRGVSCGFQRCGRATSEDKHVSRC